jgi:hypothetical protein
MPAGAPPRGGGARGVAQSVRAAESGGAVASLVGASAGAAGWRVELFAAQAVAVAFEAEDL